MSDNVNLDEIIQKKLLYKFDKLLNRFASEYQKLYRGDSNEDQNWILTALNDDIDQLEYDAFKYSAAFDSIERDDLNNESQLEQISIFFSQVDQNILAANAEIKSMQEQLQRQQIMKKNKIEFNCVAREVKNFDTKTEMNKKIHQVENQIKMLEEEHKEDMDNIAKQESYLRTALSAMKCLVESNKESNSPNK